jgi:hypothetical protein
MQSSLALALSLFIVRSFDDSSDGSSHRASCGREIQMMTMFRFAGDFMAAEPIRSQQ